MNTTLNSSLFQQVQSLILDLILEPWSQARVAMLRDVMDDVKVVATHGKIKSEIVETLILDLEELSARRIEMTRVHEIRASELQQEIAQGHRNVVSTINSHFTF